MNKLYESFPLTEEIIEKLDRNEEYCLVSKKGKKRIEFGEEIKSNQDIFTEHYEITHILLEQPLPSKTAEEILINYTTYSRKNKVGRKRFIKYEDALKAINDALSSQLQPSTVGENHNDSAIKKKQFNISPEELKDISSEKVLVIDGNSFYREDYMFYLMGKWKSSPVSLPKQEEGKKKMSKKERMDHANAVAEKINYKMMDVITKTDSLINELQNKPAALPSDEQLKDEVLNILNNILESDPAFGGFVCHKEKAAKKIVEWLSSHKQPGSDVVKFPRLKTENYRGAEWLAQLEGMSIIAQGKTEEEAINELMVSIKTKLLFDRNNQSAPELPKEETK